MPAVLPTLPTGIAPFIDPMILSRLPLFNNPAASIAPQLAPQTNYLPKNFLPIYRNNLLSQVMMQHYL